MNCMPEVLKMLGVEVNELFNIKGGECNPYLFDEEHNLLDAEYYVRNGLIRGLIIGSLEIEKLPWKPKDGENYWCVIANGDKVKVLWCGYMKDFYLYNAGNCFRTHEEITDEIKQRILSEMKGKYEND